MGGYNSIEEAVKGLLNEYRKGKAVKLLMNDLNNGLLSGQERGWHSAGEVEQALGLLP
jgi:hypothetical protein